MINMKKLFEISILIFISITLVILYVIRNNAQAIPEPDSSIFKRNCGKCHSIERPLGIEKTAIGWEKTVDWMQKKEHTFSDSESEAIKRYLKNKYSYYPKTIFETKCAKCHPLNLILQQKRTPKEWDRLVQRERKKAITWISLDEAQDITMYLGEYYGNKETDNADLSKTLAKKKELTEKKCLLCHLYTTVFGKKRTQQEWRVINQRMRYKCPQWISEKESGEITQYLIDIVSSGK